MKPFIPRIPGLQNTLPPDASPAGPDIALVTSFDVAISEVDTESGYGTAMTRTQTKLRSVARTERNTEGMADDCRRAKASRRRRKCCGGKRRVREA